MINIIIFIASNNVIIIININNFINKISFAILILENEKCTLSGKLLDWNARVIAMARSTDIGPGRGNEVATLRKIDANAKPLIKRRVTQCDTGPWGWRTGKSTKSNPGFCVNQTNLLIFPAASGREMVLLLLVDCLMVMEEGLEMGEISLVQVAWWYLTAVRPTTLCSSFRCWTKWSLHLKTWTHFVQSTKCPKLCAYFWVQERETAGHRPQSSDLRARDLEQG